MALREKENKDVGEPEPEGLPSEIIIIAAVLIIIIGVIYFKKRKKK